MNGRNRRELLADAARGVLAASVGTATAFDFRSTRALATDRPQSLSDAEFDRLHQLIRPRAGESRWMEIDWFPNVWEARKKAAAEGKPLFLMAGSGGAPVAGC